MILPWFSPELTTFSSHHFLSKFHSVCNQVNLDGLISIDSTANEAMHYQLVLFTVSFTAVADSYSLVHERRYHETSLASLTGIPSMRFYL